MKIAVVEFDYHFVLLTTFCKLFEGSSHQITVFTTEKIYAKIKEDTANLSAKFITQKNESLKEFIDEHLTQMNSNDLIFFNTIASNYKTLYKAQFTAPCILRIHNAHSYLQPFKHLHFPKNGFELFKFCSYVVREMIPWLDFIYIKKLIQKFDFICLNDLYREEYVIENKMIDRAKIFPCMPFTICESKAKDLNPNNTFLNIVIPGSIDNRRRDYTPVILALKKAMPQLKNQIKIHLLGKPIGNYGQETMSALKALENDKLQIVCFTEFVSQDKFDEIITEADILIAPLIVEHQFRIYKEVYGKSKSSGSIYDMVTYEKLTVFPTTFFVDSEMKKNIDYYDSPDTLAAILIEYCNNRGALIQKTKNLRSFLEANYSPKKILSDFEKNYSQKILNKH